MMISILLPKTSQAIQQKNKKAIEQMAYEGTKYTSILISCLCFPIMLNSSSLLVLYVGDGYNSLAVWLALWVFSLTLFLHNTPIASLVLATGKTRMLIYSSAIACVVSMLINVFLCKQLGIGSAVIGYLLYVVIQMSFYYFYFNNRILGLDSFRIFKSFIVPTLLGVIAYVSVRFMFPVEFNLFAGIITKTIVWILIFFFLLILFNVIDRNKLLFQLKKVCR